jgi:hypothetical protein
MDSGAAAAAGPDAEVAAKIGRTPNAVRVKRSRDYMWSEATVPFPAPDRLAADLGVDVGRVTKTLNKLESKGFLSTKSLESGRQGYDLAGLHDKLTELIREGESKAWVGKRSSWAES